MFDKYVKELLQVFVEDTPIWGLVLTKMFFLSGEMILMGNKKRGGKTKTKNEDECCVDKKEEIRNTKHT